MIKKVLSVIAMSLVAVMSFGQLRLRPDNIEEIVKAMTDEEIASLLVGSKEPEFYFFEGTAAGVRGIPRLGIPATISCDGPAGLHFYPLRDNSDDTFYCTAFPVGTLSASSWDPDLMELMAGAMGDEVHEYGVDMFLGPGMNIHRSPLCGRNFEYFSEDPVLSGRMAAAYVRGIQNNGVTATVKHYAANNQETNRTENDARIDQRALREIYLKNFEIAIKEGHPGALMASYNKLNGEYVQQSFDLLTTVLRDEWGYDGVVLTDHGAKEGTVKAAKAGCDLMQPGNEEELERMLDAVKKGTITRAELERNARHVLRYIVSTPRFQEYKFSNDPDLKSHAELARKVAGESIVMLKNEGGTLPLRAGAKLAVYGVGSEDFVAVGIGSGHVVAKHVANMRESLTDAGFELNQDLAGYYKAYVELDHATKRVAGAMDWLMYESWGYGKKVSEPDVPLNQLPQQAAEADVAIVVISRDAGEGNDRSMIDDYELTARDRKLIRLVSDEYHAKGKKVVVILNIGGVIESVSWKNLVDAILLPWQPGQEGAYAVADVLTGKVNPSGKLTMTFPVDALDHPSSANFPAFPQRGESEEGLRKNIDYTEYAEGIWVGYRHFTTREVPVSYPFGYGLSYTTFQYSKPVVKATADGFTASVTVTNTGSVAGKEVVEVYVSAPSGGLEKPSRELKAFGKTKSLAPGESQSLSFTVPAFDLASFNEAVSAWETAAGKYQVHFGSSVEDIRATGSFKVKKARFWEVHNVL
ncbi:MAG: glycoside hydrolase family 3 C-terminal domain-containing protein [Bacteroidales bacterium]|nr:glycoside hydrolase family 3 C-terminal domain-containing protein [Bacteroidales bacterium]